MVLADFIYTRCTDVCPLISARMQEVQARLKRENLFGSRVLLLSFSVDPDHVDIALQATVNHRARRLCCAHEHQHVLIDRVAQLLAGRQFVGGEHA